MKRSISNSIIEFMIIFIGITLAFLSENLRENFQEKQLEKKYLHSFLRDVSNDKMELEKMLKRNEQKLENVTRFLERIRNEEFLVDSLNTIIDDMTEINLFFPQTITYESVKNSGNMEIISDFALKEKLVGYYLVLENKKLFDEHYGTFTETYIMPFFNAGL